ncbi:hypothetical protein [Paenibacillus xylanexedens]|uniref:hypothetical protein n=1 Tax=Paenibacillus xylanexedens TaxID=528191 RepID=UPI00119FCD1C|nr:hypothetical protein [Paenibacillus xylanexedens]
MSKYIKLLILFLVIISMIFIYSKISEAKKQALYERAVPIGQAYFMKYYGANIIFTKYELNTPVTEDIVLYGYVKEEQQIQVSLSININTLEPRNAMGPHEFIIKRNPPLE